MAEVPPELAAEVQKLERYHLDNPQGRYFVPLANAYRKMGAVEQAEALLRDGLRRHPDYLSAHIVLGRCLADRGATDDAVSEFRYVLSVDPQNLIALRSLGELASEGGRTDEAARWFRELLAVDPMNEDARQALESLEAGPAEAAPAGDFAPEGEAEDALHWGGEVETEPEPARDEDPVLAWGAVELGAEAGDEADHQEAVEPFETLSLAEPEPADAAGEAAGEEEAWAGGEDGGWDPYAGSTVDLGTPGPETAGEGEGDEVVTETIAELYARQGFHDRAAEVYRELIRRRGGDPVLEARLAEAERLAAGQAPAEEPAGAAAEPDADLPVVEWGVETAEITTELTVEEASGTVEEEAGVPGFESFEIEPAGEEPELAAAPAGAAPEAEDAFAASFEAGFGEVELPAAAPAWEEAEEGAAWAATAEEEPQAAAPAAEEQPEEEAAAELTEEPVEEPVEEPAPAAEAAALEARNIRDYFAGLLSWQPAEGVGALPAAAPVAEAAAPLPEAPAEEPEAEEMPWLAAPVSDEPEAAGEPEPLAIDGMLAEEPAAPETGTAFSFEEFFVETPEEAPPAAPEPAAAEAPRAEEPAQPAAEPGEDEDLESFQAWLQSLKR